MTRIHFTIWGAALLGIVLSGPTRADLPPAGPGNLAITEILYYPPLPTVQEQLAGFVDQNEFEFIELLNVSAESISLEGAAFSDGVTFSFSGALEAGAYTLVVRNLAAFRMRYGPDIPVAGQYSGRLANEGETLTLSDAAGGVIHSIDYEITGPWPAIPLHNPGGYSLELINAATNPDPANPDNWQASLEREGTPGRSPDSDQDGLRDSWEREFFGGLQAEPEDDSDQDLLTNLEEYHRGTHPLQPDTDQDGLIDGVETNTGLYVDASDTGTHPLRSDTDQDGLKDGVETRTRLFVSLEDTGTDPLDYDTDDDGFGDGTELTAGKDPLNPASFPVAPRVLRFEADPLTVTVGDSLTLTWETTDADAVFLDPGVGPVANPSGQLLLNAGPVGTIIYTLVASNGYFKALSQVTVRVYPDAPPVIQEFVATPSSVGREGQVQLRWQVEGIVDQLSIDQGVGTVTGTSVIVSLPGGLPLVPKASVWKYLDDGSDQGQAWVAPDFDDQTWKLGPGPLGYGNDGLNTIISYGDDWGGTKYITSYFRREFVVSNLLSLVGAKLCLMRDDGAQVLLNGTEILRDLMPEGPIDYLTLAANHAPDDGRDYHEFLLDPLLLREGRNVLAVGLHQASATSADTQFDLELLGQPAGDQTLTYTLTAWNEAGRSTAQLDVTVRSAVQELVSYFDGWSFEDTGTPVDPSWNEPGFLEVSWGFGPGVLGVEYAGPAAPLIQTPLRLPDFGGGLITYLRHRFTLPVAPAQVRSLSLTHLVDDGAVVYLNGRQVHVIGVDPGYPMNGRIVGNAQFEGPFALPVSALVQGENVLAVELYQPYYSTTDIVWGASLEAGFALRPPGPTLGISRTNDGLRLEWSEPGYGLETAPDLTGPWETLATDNPVIDLPATAARQFFRLRRIGY